MNEGTEQSIPGKRVIRHPKYNTPPISNDIALIQLSRPATLNSRVGTVCLPSHDEVVPTSARCFITGLEQELYVPYCRLIFAKMEEANFDSRFGRNTVLKGTKFREYFPNADPH